MADGFLEAHKKMRDNRNQPVYKELNKIHDEMLKLDIKIDKLGKK